MKIKKQWCGECGKELPLMAFEKDHLYCKQCETWLARGY